MKTLTRTKTDTQTNLRFDINKPIPTLLIAYSPLSALSLERCLVADPFIVGRSPKADMTISDNKISKSHFVIEKKDNGYQIRDLESKNGTYLNGKKLVSSDALPDNSVIRSGDTVMVFHSDGRGLLEPLPKETFGMVGKFHLTPLLAELREATFSKRHILLTGPSGVGKELAARAIAQMALNEDYKNRYLTHNAARFSSEEEATTTLFGIGERVFSGVDARAGLIEKAKGGVLFLDEIHNLPQRVQRTLLRIIEEGLLSRIGDTRNKPADVIFVFASNVEGNTCGLAHDLFARLRQVPINPLTKRRADIPSVFQHVVKERLICFGVEPNSVLSLIESEHYEHLCLHGFPDDNVRGLINIADRLATRVKRTFEPQLAVTEVFSESFRQMCLSKRRQVASSPIDVHLDSATAIQRSENDKDPVDNTQSLYEIHKDLILSIYEEKESNVAATKRALGKLGISASRRSLTLYLKRWGAK